MLHIFVLHIFGKNLNFFSAYDNNFTVSQPNTTILFYLTMARYGLLSINILQSDEVTDLSQEICCN